MGLFQHSGISGEYSVVFVVPSSNVLNITLMRILSCADASDLLAFMILYLDFGWTRAVEVT